MTNNKLINAIGIIALIGLIVLIFKAMNKKAETKLYSDDALDKLQNKDSLIKLEEAITEYHKTGEWNKEKLLDV
jgi:hypothetical protein